MCLAAWPSVQGPGAWAACIEPVMVQRSVVCRLLCWLSEAAEGLCWAELKRGAGAAQHEHSTCFTAVSHQNGTGCATMVSQNGHSTSMVRRITHQPSSSWSF